MKARTGKFTRSASQAQRGVAARCRGVMRAARGFDVRIIAVLAVVSETPDSPCVRTALRSLCSLC